MDLNEVFGHDMFGQRDLEKEPYTEQELFDLEQEFGDYFSNPEVCPHNHVYPRLGYENSFIGEYCTQCGSDLDNYGKIVKNQTVSGKSLDSKGECIDIILGIMNDRNIKQ